MADKPNELEVVRLKDGTPVEVRLGRYGLDNDGGYRFHPFTKDAIAGEIANAEKAHARQIEQEAQRNGGDRKAAQSKVSNQNNAAVQQSVQTPGVKNAAGDVSKSPGSYAGAQAQTAPTDPWSDLAGSQSIPSTTKINVGPAAGPHPVLNIPGGDYTPYEQKSLEDELKSITTLGPDKLKALQQKLIDAGANGVTVNGVPDTATISAWRGILQNAALLQNAGSNLTPDDLLNHMAQTNPKNQEKTIHEKSTSVDLTDPIRARKTLEAAMADKLGRKPTDWEVSQFTSALNSYEQSNPSVTDSTVVTAGDGTEKNRTTSTTGHTTDPAAYALQYLQDSHGPEQQALNHLSWYQVAMDALGQATVQTGLGN